jgi:DNA-binding response OmpR family regulator
MIATGLSEEHRKDLDIVDSSGEQLQGLLLDAGFQVQVAEDGAQDVEKFRTWKPHLIWMAYAFPSWEGWKQHAKSGFWTAAVMPKLWR